MVTFKSPQIIIKRKVVLICLCFQMYQLCASKMYNFICVSSKCQLQRRKSHIGYICFTFQHCAMQCAFSNGMPVRMLSHIGCICLTFLHCVFSNDPSKHLYKRMQTYIGCICLTFLQCGFLHAPLKCLPAWMHSRRLALVTFV